MEQDGRSCWNFPRPRASPADWNGLVYQKHMLSGHKLSALVNWQTHCLRCGPRHIAHYISQKVHNSVQDLGPRNDITSYEVARFRYTVRWSNFDRQNPKMGFSCKVQRRLPADIFLNESLPLKTPLRTPCSWPPWPWFSREKSLKIFKVM
jgi:hypothetical protein